MCVPFSPLVPTAGPLSPSSVSLNIFPPSQIFSRTRQTTSQPLPQNKPPQPWAPSSPASDPPCRPLAAASWPSSAASAASSRPSSAASSPSAASSSPSSPAATAGSAGARLGVMYSRAATPRRRPSWSPSPVRRPRAVATDKETRGTERSNVAHSRRIIESEA